MLVVDVHLTKPAKTPILTADMALSSIHIGKYI